MKQSFRGVRMSSTVLLRSIPRLNSSFTNSLHTGDGGHETERFKHTPSPETAFSLPVGVVDAGADHLHRPLSYPAGADVPPQSQVQDQPQRAGQGAGEHHADLGQPGQTRSQLEPVPGAEDVRSHLRQEEDEEAAGEDGGDDGAQSPVQEHPEDRVSHRTQEQQGAGLGRTERHQGNTISSSVLTDLIHVRVFAGYWFAFSVLLSICLPS